MQLAEDRSGIQGAYKFGKMKFPEFSRPSKQSFLDNYSENSM